MRAIISNVIVLLFILGLASCNTGTSQAKKKEYLAAIRRPLDCCTIDMENIMTRIHYLYRDSLNISDSSYRKDLDNFHYQYEISILNIEISQKEIDKLSDFDKEFPLKLQALDMLNNLMDLYKTTVKNSIGSLRKGVKNPSFLNDIEIGQNQNIMKHRKIYQKMNQLIDKHKIKKGEIKDSQSCVKFKL